MSLTYGPYSSLCESSARIARAEVDREEFELKPLPSFDNAIFWSASTSKGVQELEVSWQWPNGKHDIVCVFGTVKINDGSVTITYRDDRVPQYRPDGADGPYGRVRSVTRHGKVTAENLDTLIQRLRTLVATKRRGYGSKDRGSIRVLYPQDIKDLKIIIAQLQATAKKLPTAKA